MSEGGSIINITSIAAQVIGTVIPVDGGTTAGPPSIHYDDIKPQPPADR